MDREFYKSSITLVEPERPSFTIETGNRNFFIGSCFAKNLYSAFDRLYLNSLFSPFGNTYNPLSIAENLNRLIENRVVTENECFIQDGLFQHSDFHSTLGGSSLENYLQKVNSRIHEASDALGKADNIIITLGTAYVYRKDGVVVNNCHKQPKSIFTREPLSIEEIVDNLLPPLNRLKELNNPNIILTLSPVRHLRDNPGENSLSKAILRVAIEKLRNKLDAYYFPSYEILLDELRDYRWYDDSLTHPTEKSTQYIMGKFFKAAGSSSLLEYIKKADKLNSMLNHKILNPGSDSSFIFMEKTEEKTTLLQKEYPYLDKLQNIRSSQYL